MGLDRQGWVVVFKEKTTAQLTESLQDIVDDFRWTFLTILHSGTVQNQGLGSRTTYATISALVPMQAHFGHLEGVPQPYP